VSNRPFSYETAEVGLKSKAKPLKSQPEARDVKAAQNGLEVIAIEDVSIAITSQNPDAINEPMYCKYKYVGLQCF
jgi:hypothetical protein